MIKYSETEMNIRVRENEMMAISSLASFVTANAEKHGKNDAVELLNRV